MAGAFCGLYCCFGALSRRRALLYEPLLGPLSQKRHLRKNRGGAIASAHLSAIGFAAQCHVSKTVYFRIMRPVMSRPLFLFIAGIFYCVPNNALFTQHHTKGVGPRFYSSYYYLLSEYYLINCRNIIYCRCRNIIYCRNILSPHLNYTAVEHILLFIVGIFNRFLICRGNIRIAD
jgi:hypothetical protein